MSILLQASISIQCAYSCRECTFPVVGEQCTYMETLLLHSRYIHMDIQNVRRHADTHILLSAHTYHAPMYNALGTLNSNGSNLMYAIPPYPSPSASGGGGPSSSSSLPSSSSSATAGGAWAMTKSASSIPAHAVLSTESTPLLTTADAATNSSPFATGGSNSVSSLYDFSCFPVEMSALTRVCKIVFYGAKKQTCIEKRIYTFNMSLYISISAHI